MVGDTRLCYRGLNLYYMKTIYFALLLGCLVTVSCKKHHDDLGVPADVAAGSYLIDTTSTTVHGSGWTKPVSAAVLHFYNYIGCLSCPVIDFQFWIHPQSDGDYRIVRTAAANNEVSISTTSGIARTYYSTDTDGGVAHLIIRDGKVTIQGNNVRMKSVDTSAADVMLSFNLTEF